MFAFVCSDAIAPNARMVVLRTTRIAHTRITISSQHASHACLSRSLSRVVILLDTECLERNSGQVALVTPKTPE